MFWGADTAYLNSAEQVHEERQAVCWTLSAPLCSPSLASAPKIFQ